jgi:two-component system, OmpR family, response regulator MtrA
MTPSPAPKKILIVEDDLAIRRLLEVCLRALPATQIAVGGGHAALEVLGREPVDLVVTDLMMAGIGGFDIVRAMRADAALRDIPVVLLSCLGNPSLPQEAKEAGVQAYFMKPFSHSQLINTARHLLAI